jgi:signal peptidase I
LDFALILVVATFVTGVIWAFDALLLKRARLARSSGGRDIREPVIVEYARSFFPILLLVLVLRSFLFEPFRIPSGIHDANPAGRRLHFCEQVRLRIALAGFK